MNSTISNSCFIDVITYYTSNNVTALDGHFWNTCPNKFIFDCLIEFWVEKSFLSQKWL